MAVRGDFGFVERSGYEVLTKIIKKIKNDYFNKIDKIVDNRMEDSFKSDYLN
jgi:hypothetical protein